MTYFDGILLPVPAGKRDDYRAAAGRMADFLRENGALRVVDAWGDGLEHGKTTDFYMAVEASEGENVVFSWAEWPSKAVRDTAAVKMRETPLAGSSLDGPFDGRRVVVGGFEPLLDEQAAAVAAPAYVDGFVIPVPHDRRDDYLKMAAVAAPIFREFGALRVVEAWGDDVAHGHTTDFYRTAKAEDGENIVFSWIEWPSKAARDAGNAKVMADARMNMDGDMAFNPQRMIWGGFEIILDEGGK